MPSTYQMDLFLATWDNAPPEDKVFIVDTMTPWLEYMLEMATCAEPCEGTANFITYADDIIALLAAYVPPPPT